MELSKIPGLPEAVAAAEAGEEHRRDLAMLGIPVEIAGCLVRQITTRDLITLMHSRCPFLTGGEIMPEDAALVLHLLSPGFETGPEARAAAAAKLAGVVFADAVAQLHDLFNATFADSPACCGPNRAAIASWAASMVHPIAAEYGWPDEVLDAAGKPVLGAGVLDKPIARLYQYIRLIQRDADPSMVFFNSASDRVRREMVNAWLAKVEARKAATAQSFDALAEIPDVRKEEKE